MNRTDASLGLVFLLLLLFAVVGCSGNPQDDPVRLSFSSSTSISDNHIRVTVDKSDEIQILTGNISDSLKFEWIENGISATNCGDTIYDLKLLKDKNEFSFGIVEKGMTTPPLAVLLTKGDNDYEISFSEHASVEINGLNIHTDGYDPTHELWIDQMRGYIDNEVLFGFVDGTTNETRHRVIREHNLFLVGLNDGLGMHVGRIDDGRSPVDVVRDLSKESSVKLPTTNNLARAAFWPSDHVWSPLWPDDYRWSMMRIQAKDAWDIYSDGVLDDQGDASVDKIVICVADTGIHPHVEFNKDYWHWWAAKNFSKNFISPGVPPIDIYGHGTAVAGIAGATGDNAMGMAGVCWNPYILSVKCLGDSGYGSIEAVGNAIHYIGEVASQFPWMKFIANFSLAHWGADPWGQQAATESNSYPNTLLIAAAGNSGWDYADWTYPAAYAEFMSIGASSINMSGGLDKEVYQECPHDWGSNWGTTVDVCAPGSMAVTTINVPWTPMYTGYPDPDCPMSCTGWYCQYMGGTSAATPHVVGLAALLWNKNPDWTKEDVKEKIKSTADEMNIPAEKVGKLGTGRINAYRALTE